MLTPTILTKAIAILSSKVFGDYDSRMSNYGAISSMNYAPNFINPSEITRLRTAPSRPVSIEYLPKQVYTGAPGTLACDFTAIDTTSTTATLVWENWVPTNGFRLVKENYSNNTIKYAEDLAHQIMSVQRSFYEYLDARILAYYNTNRTQINAYSLFNAAPDAVEVPAIDRNTLFYKIKTMMETNDFSADDNVFIANTEIIELLTFLQAQGSSNATNFAYQFAGLDVLRSNRLLPTAGSKYTGFAFPKGSVALVEWNTARHKVQNGAAEYLIGRDYWTEIADPMFGNLFSWSLHYKASCQDGAFADYSPTAVPSYVEKFQLSVDFSLFKPTISPATFSNIFKVEALS